MLEGKFLALIHIIAFSIVFTKSSAYGEIRFDQGWWRAELTGGIGVDSVSTSDREGDFLVTAAAEYEFPAMNRLSLGLRLVPFFLYEQDGNNETVWGGGAGLAGRLYLLEDEYSGLYAEAAGNGIVHENKIRGNSSNFNFLISAGIGYRFRNNWFSAVKYSHISNANFGSRNSGAETVSLAVGYSF
ncbi:MAG: acyloxyacyl hydrolase [Desulfobulbaceae bacterium]|nr:acyloxyacyl hydrolase [Desulfobulbaceae bacterium]